MLGAGDGFVWLGPALVGRYFTFQSSALPGGIRKLGIAVTVILIGLFPPPVLSKHHRDPGQRAALMKIHPCFGPGAAKSYAAARLIGTTLPPAAHWPTMPAQVFISSRRSARY